MRTEDERIKRAIKRANNGQPFVIETFIPARSNGHDGIRKLRALTTQGLVMSRRISEAENIGVLERWTNRKRGLS